MTSCQQLSFLQWVHFEGITQTNMYWAVLCCVVLCVGVQYRAASHNCDMSESVPGEGNSVWYSAIGVKENIARRLCANQLRQRNFYAVLCGCCCCAVLCRAVLYLLLHSYAPWPLVIAR
jgi:hypothetical protein